MVVRAEIKNRMDDRGSGSGMKFFKIILF